MPRKIRDRRDAVACLAGWEASGQTLAAWAQAHGVDGRSLHCWKMNLCGRGGMAGLVELVPTGGVEEVGSRRPAQYVVRLNGVEVVLDDGFEASTLSRLLGVVAAC